MKNTPKIRIFIFYSIFCLIGFFSKTLIGAEVTSLSEKTEMQPYYIQMAPLESTALKDIFNYSADNAQAHLEVLSYFTAWLQRVATTNPFVENNASLNGVEKSKQDIVNQAFKKNDGNLSSIIQKNTGNALFSKTPGAEKTLGFLGHLTGGGPIRTAFFQTNIFTYFTTVFLTGAITLTYSNDILALMGKSTHPPGSTVDRYCTPCGLSDLYSTYNKGIADAQAAGAQQADVREKLIQSHKNILRTTLNQNADTIEKIQSQILSFAQIVPDYEKALAGTDQLVDKEKMRVLTALLFLNSKLTETQINIVAARSLLVQNTQKTHQKALAATDNGIPSLALK